LTLAARLPTDTHPERSTPLPTAGLQEQKALKDKVKKLGKKGKDEAARLEAEMAAR